MQADESHAARREKRKSRIATNPFLQQDSLEKAEAAKREADEASLREEEDLPDYYFVDGDGVQHGPVSIGQMKEYWDGGYLNHESIVFASDGSLESWTALEEATDLFSRINAPPPNAARR